MFSEATAINRIAGAFSQTCAMHQIKANKSAGPSATLARDKATNLMFVHQTDQVQAPTTTASKEGRNTAVIAK